ncbi:MAG: efflux RND transporter permease subunit [Fibrobacter sp.]|nr:efflux RND transporter permease subunit [Fibrobacter sp.]
MFLVNLGVKRPASILMIILMFVVFGIINYFKLPVDLFPHVESKYITISTSCPDLGASEIALTVLKPIEEAVGNVNGIRNVVSFAYENAGSVVIEFNSGVNIDRAMSDIRNRVDNIADKFPQTVKKPLVTTGRKDDNSTFFLVLEGNQSLEAVRTTAENTVKESLLRINDVESVSVIGGQKREILVSLQRQYGEKAWASSEFISSIIALKIKNTTIGSVSGNRKEYKVTILGENGTIEQIKNIAVPVGKDICEPLGSIADVSFANSKLDELCRINGQNCVGISVIAKSDANMVQFTNQIKRTSRQLNEKLPDGMFINIVSDKYSRVLDTVQEAFKGLLWGLVLVIAMLILFAGGFRMAFITMLTTLISVIITFNVMYLADYSFNILTVVSLTAAICIMVSNAIIVIHAIQKYINADEQKTDAVIKGTNESCKIIAGIDLSVIAVFIPSMVVDGYQFISFYKQAGTVIVSGVVVSFLLCLTFIPLVSAAILDKSSRIQKMASSFWGWFADLYGELLKFMVKFNAAVVVFFAVFCVFSIWYLVPKIGVKLFPESNGSIQITIEMLSGASFSETNLALSQAERKIVSIPEIESFYSTIYNNNTDRGANIAAIDLELKKERTKSIQEIINDIKPLLTEIPDAKVSVVQTSQFTNSKKESDIVIEIAGESIDEITGIADTVAKMAQTINGLADITVTPRGIKPQVKLIPNIKKIDEYEITIAEIGRTVKTYLLGKEIAFFDKNNDKHIIRVQCSNNDQNPVIDIENIPIHSFAAGSVPLKNVLHVEYTNENSSLVRKNGMWITTVGLNVISGDISSKTEELKKLTDNITLKTGNKIQYRGEAEKTDKVSGVLFFVFVLAIALLFMALAGSLESVCKPLIVMVAALFGNIGGLWALFITGHTVSLLSVMLLVILTGMVTGSAVVLIVNMRRADKKGDSYLDSVISVCKENFRTVVAVGLVPVLAFVFWSVHIEPDLQALTVTFIGEIILSIIAVLLVVPVFYSFHKQA